jgi:glyoxylase-like metal-dependent hydrolase (beta-lactamase superfamily II)
VVKPIMTSFVPAVKSYTSSGGARIFQIPVEDFPGLLGNVYLVVTEDQAMGKLKVLIDAGSGFGDANLQLEAGLAEASNQIGEPITLDNLTHILITHAHIDHFGGLSYIYPRTHAKIGVHELDRRVLTNYEERLTVIARRLNEFLVEAGVADEQRKYLLDLYKITKSLYRSVKVSFTYEAIGMRLGPFDMLHVPGHCAGHVVIRLQDVLFTGDHVLEHTSPHQSPEHLTMSTGLDHYLQSLDTLRPWAERTRLALGGHELPIENLPARMDAIRDLHRERLAKVMDLLKEPHTIAEVSRELFHELHGYDVLLGLEEAGAHVEYLYQRGLLGIANLAELEIDSNHSPVRYYRLGDD